LSTLLPVFSDWHPNITVAALLLPAKLRYRGSQGLRLPSRVRNQRFDDKEVALAAVAQNGTAFYQAVDDVKNDKDIVLAVFRQLGLAVDDGMSVKDMWITRVKDGGGFFGFASDEMKRDKEEVMAAVTKNGSSLEYVKGGLNQDADCLKAAGLWDVEDNK